MSTMTHMVMVHVQVVLSHLTEGRKEMALTSEDMELLGSFIDQKVKDAVGNAVPAQPAAPEDSPDVAARKAAEPWYYVHLANGQVLETQDSASTHFDVDGSLVNVIGRFPKGAG